MAPRDESQAQDVIQRRVGRRRFFRIAAGGASVLTLAACGRGDPQMAPPAPPTPPAPIAAAAPAALHGAPLAADAFSRLFPALPPATFGDAALLALADAMIAPQETDAQGRPHVTPESEGDDEENYGLPAGYTYFGQFVDHDITFDPRSVLGQPSKLGSLTNFRTPSFDLDGLYGYGPADQPYMYMPDGRKFVLGDRNLTGGLREGGPIVPLTRDLPRFHGRAIIGDKRNDENVIVSQIQGLFLRFHNFLADAYPDRPFAEIQRLVRWHYQWLVVFDYLPRIIGREQVAALLPMANGGNAGASNLRFFDWRAGITMPVEFSGAAYRFGHSLVRPAYRLSAADLRTGNGPTGLGGRRLLFAPNAADGLNGFQEFAAENGIDWRLFFPTRDRPFAADRLGKGRVQPAYKIDTSLVTALGFLPEFSRPGSNNPAGAPNTNSLSYRNLKRGVTLQLPTGQDVARQMGIAPLADDRLRVGKATADGLEENPAITALHGSFAGAAPLWFYVLAEAQDQWRQAAETQATKDAKNAQPTLLGPVGGRIVGEVVLGLLLGDSESFLNTDPSWRPQFGDQQAASLFDRFTMGDLIGVVPGVGR